MHLCILLFSGSDGNIFRGKSATVSQSGDMCYGHIKTLHWLYHIIILINDYLNLAFQPTLCRQVEAKMGEN